MSIEYQQYKNLILDLDGNLSITWKNRLSYDLSYVEGGIEIIVNPDIIVEPFEVNICGTKLNTLAYSSSLIISAVVISVVANVITVRANKQISGLTMECEDDDITVLLEVVQL
jgi:hypothetical protein